VEGACARRPVWKVVVAITSSTFYERVGFMDMDFFSSWTFIGIMVFLLLLLVAFLVYRLMFAKKDDE
jgi:hypothetical protein